ncbi:MAG: divalent-cation tolerance protein CutA [Acidobacteriota bacterium]
MTEALLVLTTIDTERSAQRIAGSLVEQRLAACVNIVKSVRSIYRWKEKIHDDEELILLIKTERSRFEDVRKVIQELHSYEMPDIIAVPIEFADSQVLDWVAESVRLPGQSSS